MITRLKYKLDKHRVKDENIEIYTLNNNKIVRCVWAKLAYIYLSNFMVSSLVELFCASASFLSCILLEKKIYGAVR